MRKLISVTIDEFVDTWVEAYLQHEGREWIATQLDISGLNVKNRANVLRSKGIKLPRLWYWETRDKLNQSDVDKYNQLINKATK